MTSDDLDKMGEDFHGDLYEAMGRAWCAANWEWRGGVPCPVCEDRPWRSEEELSLAVRTRITAATARAAVATFELRCTRCGWGGTCFGWCIEGRSGGGLSGVGVTPVALDDLPLVAVEEADEGRR